MTKHHVIAEAYAAMQRFYRGAPGQPGIVPRVLGRLFRLLSSETQLWLARDVTIGMGAACLTAKDRWGEDGNVIVDGNEWRVGTGYGAGFVVLGRGPTWQEAFADARRRRAGSAS